MAPGSACPGLGWGTAGARPCPLEGPSSRPMTRTSSFVQQLHGLAQLELGGRPADRLRCGAPSTPSDSRMSGVDGALREEAHLVAHLCGPPSSNTRDELETPMILRLSFRFGPPSSSLEGRVGGAHVSRSRSAGSGTRQPPARLALRA